MSLVELMAVVAIIGVLAVLAGVGYGRWTRSARTAEATNLVGAIRTGQEAYFSQTNQYLDLSKSTDVGDLHPGPPLQKKQSWEVACKGCNPDADWSRLGVKATEPVWFGYATIAGTEGVEPKARANVRLSSGSDVVWNAGRVPDRPWFVVVARADANGDGKFATVWGSSFSGQIFTDGDGE
jgi:type IV pilus assembly protein PilA